jgi:hypothetical protein
MKTPMIFGHVTFSRQRWASINTNGREGCERKKNLSELISIWIAYRPQAEITRAQLREK